MLKKFISLIFLSLILETNSVFFTTQCPLNCICDNSASILTITCSQSSSSFALPYTTDLSSTLSIITKSNSLQKFPTNLCLFSSTLRILDITSNIISDNITSTTFNCLTSLEFLNASHNSILNIDENAFSSLNSLTVLDLSYNLINYLPTNLFAVNKLPKLQFLLLNNNYLLEIDVWFFYLKSISVIDLTNNQISKFNNRVGYTPFKALQSTRSANATRIDLRFNQIKNFDDAILSSYYLCQPYQVATFLFLMSAVQIEQNPLECSCSSYNLLMYYKTLSGTLINNTNSNIYKAVCLSPSQYLSKSIFSFTDYSTTCAGSIYAQTVSNCQSSTTLNSITIQNPNNPELLVGNIQEVSTNLTDGQIAGVVIGFLGAFILMMVLLYCICPIEILACLFGLFPSFYTICPCKSGVITNRKYDLFISYNQSSEQWIKKKLIPSISENNSIRNYSLQYGETNIDKEDFNQIVKDSMENSACILIVVSDEYLIKEWQNQEFKNHIRYLLTKVPSTQADRTRLICIQMNDVCDEEVDDYIRHQLQLPRFISLENDEFYFWQKLKYFLHTNNVSDIEKILPINFNGNVDLKVNDNIDFRHYNIKAPIVHLPPKDQFKNIANVFSQNEKKIDVKREALILNKQRIKVSKQLLRSESSVNETTQNERAESPTDFALDMISKRASSKIILGKIKRERNPDTKIRVDRPPGIELNVVKKESKNIKYGMSSDHDFTAEVKMKKKESNAEKMNIENEEQIVTLNSNLKSSLKQKNVRFNKELNKNQTFERDDTESEETTDKNEMLLSEKKYEDYEAMLNMIEGGAEDSSLNRIEKKVKVTKTYPSKSQDNEDGFLPD